MQRDDQAWGGRRGVGVVVVASLLVFTACANGDGSAEGVTSSVTVPSSVTPGPVTTADPPTATSLPPLDTGVASGQVLVGGISDWDSVVDGLPRANADSSDLTIEFSSCHLRAPGEWVLSGNARIPANEDGVDVVVGIYQLTNSDVIRSYPVRFTLEGSGEFSLLIDGIAAQRGLEPDPRPALRPLVVDTCVIDLANASLPAVRSSTAIAATRNLQPVLLGEPAGTVQALGEGAILADVDDPRIPWAYLAWGRQVFGIETMWVPDLPGTRLVDIGAESTDPCVHVGIRTMGRSEDEVFVGHWRDCDLTSWIGTNDGAPSAVPGFDVVETTVGTTVLVTDKDGTIIIIETEDDSPLATLEAVAASLEPYTNRYFKEADAPGTSDDLDTAIAEALAPIKATERGRFALDDGFVVVATYVEEMDFGPEGGPSNVLSNVLLEMFTVRNSNGRWMVEPSGGGGGGDLCLLTSGAGATQNGELVSWASWLVAVGAETSWTIQLQNADGWSDLPTVDGVYFEGSTDKPIEWPTTPLRAVDDQGRPIRCSTYEKAPTENWSPWQPPTARNDLVLEVDSAAGVQPGDVITVTGSGFYPDSAVTLRLCRFETTNWVDFWDCEAAADRSEEAYLERFADVDSSGTFVKELRIGATFETFLGDIVDCREERCVIRADGDRSYHQAGWVDIEFTRL